MPDNEHYSNPMAPANYRPHDDGESGVSHPLTNDDFRKLLMTPAAPGASSSQRFHGSTPSTAQQKSSSGPKSEGTSEASDKRKKKKQYYAKVVREEKAREEERNKKYRDRAKERREMLTNDDQIEINLPSATAAAQQAATAATATAAAAGNYKSVAPDLKGNFDAAARRKQIIEESKFLGGDLEHTHMVKGLDYALLQKVRAEIGQIDDDFNKDEDVFVKPTTKITPIGSGSFLEKKKANVTETKTSTTSTTSTRTVTPEEEEEQRLGLKSSMAKNIFRTLFRSAPKKVNELFLPHRMAYIIDLGLSTDQDDGNERSTNPIDDIPTTLIRSKADCPNADTITTISNNDIVINKLTQILSYLRHSKRDLKKQKKKGIGPFGNLEPEMNIKPSFDSNVNSVTNKTKEISMYDDIGDYIPDIKRRSTTNSSSDQRKKSYFHQESKSTRHDDDVVHHDASASAEAVKNFIRNVHNKYNPNPVDERSTSSSTSKSRKGDPQVKFDDDSYAECYPGTMAEEDVNIDSDEEPDFDKMDMGSKKGPVGRWDFDTAEEYSDYMGQKEAMPKAAFQYGVKMNDGRKTRRGAGPKDEKQKLDREWNQISKIIETKRKGGDSKEISDSPGISASKRSKMT